MNNARKQKIVCRVFGGLGNQLFCYAAARRLALISDAELVIDDISGFKYDHKYRREYQLDHFSINCRKAAASERFEPFSRIRRYVIKLVNKNTSFQDRTYIRQEGVDFDSRIVEFLPKKDLYLDGYWQSENYFKDIESDIRKDLKFKNPVSAKNIAMASYIKKVKSVAVHFRFFDSAGSDLGNNVALEYYKSAFSYMKTIDRDFHYFVFSDNLEAAKSNMGISDSKVTFVDINQGDDSAHADLWLMSKCQHFIIANSTFSWWGAWLSENKEKVVVAPKFNKSDGVSSWGFIGLLPSNWIKM